MRAEHINEGNGKNPKVIKSCFSSFHKELQEDSRRGATAYILSHNKYQQQHHTRGPQSDYGWKNSASPTLMSGILNTERETAHQPCIPFCFMFLNVLE